MAGMLPGVECARRRRFHQSGGSSDTPTNTMTRRSSFCLYTSNHESRHSSSSSSSISSLGSIIINQAYQDEKLGGIAREAKERLDERLRTQRKSSETKGQNVKERMMKNNKSIHTEVYGSKKSSGSKRFSWSKLSWKACEQEECAICLERFKVGETLVHLPCAHRFDSRCLLPWLETNAHCPCCRMEILHPPKS